MNLVMFVTRRPDESLITELKRFYFVHLFQDHRQVAEYTTNKNVKAICISSDLLLRAWENDPEFLMDYEHGSEERAPLIVFHESYESQDASEEKLRRAGLTIIHHPTSAADIRCFVEARTTVVL